MALIEFETATIIVAFAGLLQLVLVFVILTSVNIVVLKPENREDVEVRYGGSTAPPSEIDPTFPEHEFKISQKILIALCVLSGLIFILSFPADDKDFMKQVSRIRCILQVVLVALLCVFTHYYLKIRKHYDSDLITINNSLPPHIYGLSVSMIIIAIVNLYSQTLITINSHLIN